MSSGYSYKASCARMGEAVICNFWQLGTPTLSPECQSARMSKITNDGFTQVKMPRVKEFSQSIKYMKSKEYKWHQVEEMHFVPEDVDVGSVSDSTPDVGMCHTHCWHHTLNVSI